MVSSRDPGRKKWPPTVDPDRGTPEQPRRQLGRAASPEIGAAPGSVILVPVGSCEQHGPHLPLDTDTRVAVAVATGLAEQRGDVLVAPPVPFGASGEHQSFPGTLSVGTEALATFLVELGRSAFPRPEGSPFRALIFVNGHGGNAAAVRSAVATLVGERRPVAAWAATIPGGDAHAGRTETSLLLAVAPELVRAQRPVGNTAPLAEIIGDLRESGVAAVAPDGVLGDATGATREEGHRLLKALVADLDELVEIHASAS